MQENHEIHDHHECHDHSHESHDHHHENHDHSHGSHEHHHENHDHSHESHDHHHERHDHSSKETPVSREELLALLSYMVSHNQHHAEELSELAKQADGTAREALTKAISLFDEGNKQLELALDQMKNHT